MSEFLSNYALFSMKLFTILVLSFGFIALIASLFSGNKHVESSYLDITKINDDLDSYRDALEEELLSKSELKTLHKKRKKEEKEEEDNKSNLFVLSFDGDVEASDTESIRECISAIILVAKKEDEVLVILESPGGYVANYGFAASQLARLKEHNIHLTVAVDIIAASGGYMMAVVANEIIASPFAMLGSIGVLAEIPNFNRLLSKHEIDIEHHTAGEYKTTLTTLAKNTDKGRKKFQEELDDTHILFKNHVAAFRPQLDIDKIATGEVWYGSQGVEIGLCDKVQTSDDYILEKKDSHNIFCLNIKEPESLKDKISDIIKGASTTLVNSIRKISTVSKV